MLHLQFRKCLLNHSSCSWNKKQNKTRTRTLLPFPIPFSEFIARSSKYIQYSIYSHTLKYHLKTTVTSCFSCCKPVATLHHASSLVLSILLSVQRLSDSVTSCFVLWHSVQSKAKLAFWVCPALCALVFCCLSCLFAYHH